MPNMPLGNCTSSSVFAPPQAVDARDRVAHLDDGAHLVLAHLRARALDLLFEYSGDFVGVDHFIPLYGEHSLVRFPLVDVAGHASVLASR